MLFLSICLIVIDFIGPDNPHIVDLTSNSGSIPSDLVNLT